MPERVTSEHAPTSVSRAETAPIAADSTRWRVSLTSMRAPSAMPPSSPHLELKHLRTRPGERRPHETSAHTGSLRVRKRFAGVDIDRVLSSPSPSRACHSPHKRYFVPNSKPSPYVLGDQEAEEEEQNRRRGMGTGHIRNYERVRYASRMGGFPTIQDEPTRLSATFEVSARPRATRTPGHGPVQGGAVILLFPRCPATAHERRPRQELSASTGVSSAPRGPRAEAQECALAFPEHASSKLAPANVSRAEPAPMAANVPRWRVSHPHSLTPRSLARERHPQPDLSAFAGYECRPGGNSAPSPAWAQRQAAFAPKLKSACARRLGAPLQRARNGEHLTRGTSAYRGGLHALMRFAGFDTRALGNGASRPRHLAYESAPSVTSPSSVRTHRPSASLPPRCGHSTFTSVHPSPCNLCACARRHIRNPEAEHAQTRAKPAPTAAKPARERVPPAPTCVPRVHGASPHSASTTAVARTRGCHPAYSSIILSLKWPVSTLPPSRVLANRPPVLPAGPSLAQNQRLPRRTSRAGASRWRVALASMCAPSAATPPSPRPYGHEHSSMRTGEHRLRGTTASTGSPRVRTRLTGFTASAPRSRRQYPQPLRRRLPDLREAASQGRLTTNGKDHCVASQHGLSAFTGVSSAPRGLRDEAPEHAPHEGGRHQRRHTGKSFPRSIRASPRADASRWLQCARLRQQQLQISPSF
ncbi:hypothetical protein BD626DRAFT_568854 [Schizophyllum amplum]|uniref:Uncharacterized protein n=1 Tax=Schizophyllum amplum TaxID=97359 RepID=A0A550CF71_9AGAR|nr:hypothetical protein BD626DRAFT_568854 [Auriculariopsis ampla]